MNMEDLVLTYKGNVNVCADRAILYSDALIEELKRKEK